MKGGGSKCGVGVCSCASQTIVAVLAGLSILILLALAVLAYALWKVFGIQYLFGGGYHYDAKGDGFESLVMPCAFVPGRFQGMNVSAVFSGIRVAINLPKLMESAGVPANIGSEELARYMRLPPGVDIAAVRGGDGKIYAVFLHYARTGITLLCWINLRYAKQWRCFVDTKLVRPFYLDKSVDFSGKCWSCVAYFYELVRVPMWEIWRDGFRDRTSQLVVAGHSLGGAMAPVAALDLCMNDDMLGARNMFVQISGSPRCGDLEFVARYDTLLPNTWNIQNTYDLVTLTPQFSSNACAYAHVGKGAYFSYHHPNGLWASHLLKTYLDHFEERASDGDALPVGGPH